jgi:hypothetical protein
MEDPVEDQALMLLGARARSPGVAYILWAFCAIGLCGLQRIYMGKRGSGLLYLFTFGLFGIGQLIDLFLIPEMVRRENLDLALLMGVGSRGQLARQLTSVEPPKKRLPPAEEMRMALLRAADERGGRLTVTQGVLATGKTFKEVEDNLDGMLRSGYVGIDNDIDSGIVVYVFHELR